MKPSEKLIQETKDIICLSLFLRGEVGLKENLTARELKRLLYALKVV